MDIAGLKSFTALAIGKDPAKVGDNPEWDSLDKLEIITALYEEFGDGAADIPDEFTDLENLADILRQRGLVD